MSLLWGGEALSVLAQPLSVVCDPRSSSRLVGNWPDDLPSNDGNTLVVAGLEGCLDLLDADRRRSMAEVGIAKPRSSPSRTTTACEAALVFWLPTGKNRVKMNRATEAYSWVCSAPHSNQHTRSRPDSVGGG